MILLLDEDKYRAYYLILFIVVTALTIAFAKQINEALDRTFIVGKDNGITRRLELILFFSTVSFILFSNKMWWWRPFMGFVIGLIAAIIGYITASIIWPGGIDSLILFHSLSCLYYLIALYLLNYNKKTAKNN